MVELSALFIYFGAKKTSKRPDTPEPYHLFLFVFLRSSIIKGFSDIFTIRHCIVVTQCCLKQAKTLKLLKSLSHLLRCSHSLHYASVGIPASKPCRIISGLYHKDALPTVIILPIVFFICMLNCLVCLWSLFFSSPLISSCVPSS